MVLGAMRVLLFIVTHLPDHRETPGIRGGQALQMAFQVFHDLLLRLRQESQIGSITDHTGGNTNDKGA